MKIFRKFSKLKYLKCINQYSIQNKINYNFCNKNIFDDILKYENILEKSSFLCNGCGCSIQYKKKDEIGYLDKQKIIDNIKFNELQKLKKEIYQDQEFVNTNQQDIEKYEFQSVKELKILQKQNICERCYNLKNHNKNLQQQHIVKELSHDSVMKLILNKIQSNCFIIYIIDAFNLQCSIDKELIQKLIKKQSEIIIVVNKYDVIPKNTNDSIFRTQIKQIIKSKFPDDAYYNLHFVSSIKGEGMKNIIEYLQQQHQLHKEESKKVYVIGNTNTGKSTFLNKLNQIQSKKYSKKIDQIQNFSLLTTSSFPNTTLDFIKIKNIHLGFPLYDTPGIPIKIQSQQNKFIEFGQKVLITKQLAPVIIPLQELFCIFIGGFCRIDFSEGNQLDFHIFCNSNISIHKTNIKKANQLYLKQYGDILKPIYQQDIRKMQFEKHEIEIKCDKYGISEQEIEIFQIGIISFRSNQKYQTNTKLILYLPQEIQFSLREKIFKTEKTEYRNKKSNRHIK